MQQDGMCRCLTYSHCQYSYSQGELRCEEESAQRPGYYSDDDVADGIVHNFGNDDDMNIYNEIIDLTGDENLNNFGNIYNEIIDLTGDDLVGDLVHEIIDVTGDDFSDEAGNDIVGDLGNDFADEAGIDVVGEDGSGPLRAGCSKPLTK